MTKHTLGPWRWRVQNAREMLTGDPSEDMLRADIIGASKADARLIAAAPEMLAALKQTEILWKGIPAEYWPGREHGLRTVREAIAAAENGQ